ncbi:MAG: FHA domain-containing protein [Actinomycetota bacterium]
MPVIVLDLLKYAFLVILYLFIARAVRAIYVELRPPARAPVSRPIAPAPTRQQSRRGKKTPARVVLLEGATTGGKTFTLADELLIGRAEKCQIVLTDSYASQMHARIFAKDAEYMIEDLGSTNGTYLNRHKVTTPTSLSRGDQIKIGKTVLELRK